MGASPENSRVHRSLAPISPPITPATAASTPSAGRPLRFSSRPNIQMPTRAPTATSTPKLVISKSPMRNRTGYMLSPLRGSCVDDAGRERPPSASNGADRHHVPPMSVSVSAPAYESTINGRGSQTPQSAPACQRSPRRMAVRSVLPYLASRRACPAPPTRQQTDVS